MTTVVNIKMPDSYFRAVYFNKTISIQLYLTVFKIILLYKIQYLFTDIVFYKDYNIY